MTAGPARGRSPLPRALWTVLVHAVITQGVIFVIRPTLSYRALEIGLDPVYIGVLAASYTLLPLLVALQLGRLSDRFGERRLMLLGSIGMVLAVGLIVVAGHQFGVLIGASVLLGISHIATAIGQQSMVGRIVPRSRMSAGFAYYTLTGSVGQAVAPGLIALFGAGQAIPDTQAILVVALVCIALAVPVPLLLPGRRAGTTAGVPARGAVLELLGIRGLPSAVVISGIVLAAIDVFTVYLPVLGLERGLSAGAVSLLLVVRALTSLVSRVLLEPMVDRFGVNRVLTGTIAIAVVSMGAVPLIGWMPLLVAVMVPLGLGLGLAQPITMAWVAAIAPGTLRGSAMSLRLTGNRLGQTVMPILAGSVAGAMGAGGVMGVVTVSLLVGGVLAMRVDVAEGSGGGADEVAAG